jgi:hypothetical protein
MTRVPSETKLHLNLQTIPRECAVDVRNYIRRRLERNVVEEANKQIKTTKTAVGSLKATSLLLIENDGDYGANPCVILNGLARCLRDECTSINSMSCFSLNMRVTVPDRAGNAMFWRIADVLGREQPTFWAGSQSHETSQRVRSGWIPGTGAIE